jgi:hypothetical protein
MEEAVLLSLMQQIIDAIGSLKNEVTEAVTELKAIRNVLGENSQS